MDKATEKLVAQAHTRICRRKGSEYAPTTREIATEINNYQMKNLIKEKLVAYLMKKGVDRYGQIQVLQPNEVFGDKTAEVLEYNSNNRIFWVATYGGRWGTYQAFNVSDIVDKEIQQACYDASRENPTYKHAMTSW